MAYNSKRTKKVNRQGRKFCSANSEEDMCQQLCELQKYEEEDNHIVIK